MALPRWRMWPLLVLLPLSLASFSPAFHRFVTEQYGREVADRLNRNDIGPHGSYGGGEHRGGRRSRQRAVILVHGITNTAGDFAHVAAVFRRSGFSDESVFATTYGDGGKTPLPMVSMKCDYVKQVRTLIKAVAAFTRRKVNVVGFSMGSPIARKAIKGGPCVDSGERLGPPLTPLVDTFISVAGANHGSFLCVLPLPFGSCSAIEGLHCNSKFLADVNSRFVFSVYSPRDDKVGYQACGRLASQIDGADGNFERDGNHDEVMANTAALQVKLVQEHHP